MLARCNYTVLHHTHPRWSYNMDISRKIDCINNTTKSRSKSWTSIAIIKTVSHMVPWFEPLSLKLELLFFSWRASSYATLKLRMRSRKKFIILLSLEYCNYDYESLLFINYELYWFPPSNRSIWTSGNSQQNNNYYCYTFWIKIVMTGWKLCNTYLRSWRVNDTKLNGNFLEVKSSGSKRKIKVKKKVDSILIF